MSSDGGDDKVAGRLRRHLRGRTSGAETDFDYWGVATLRNGKVRRLEWFADKAQALKAVGLSE